MSLSDLFTGSTFWIIFTVVIVAISIAASLILVRVIRNSYGSGNIKNGVTAQASGVIAVASVPKFQPGCAIWVKYDPNNLTRVTIDHS